MRSGKHATQRDAKDVDFEVSVINAIESDVNMNNNYGKEGQQLQYENQNSGMACTVSPVISVILIPF